MSAVDVVTDLLGEIIEIYEWDERYLLKARGTVRALYLAEGHLMVLVEHNLGYESVTWDDRWKDGGFGAYEMLKNRVRAVQRCARCASWDQKALMEQEAIVWEHRPGQGCKEVGHDG
jgi:hypothetical protein